MPWRLPDTEAELLSLATGYPYSRALGSYLFRNGQAHALEPGVGDGALYKDRVPVIGHGSNRSSEQLARKYGDQAVIPVSQAWLQDYDIVYSAHMTRYGAIAANLKHTPGVSGEVWVAWLDEAQLHRMHETELGAEIYRFGWLEDVRMDLHAGPSDAIDHAGLYLSTYGYLAQDGEAIGLAAVPSRNRSRPSLSQEATLALVQARYRPQTELTAMILEAIREPHQRHALIAEMRAEAIAPDAPHFQMED